MVLFFHISDWTFQVFNGCWKPCSLSHLIQEVCSIIYYCEAYTTIIPHFQLRKRGLREISLLGQGHTTDTWWSWVINLAFILDSQRLVWNMTQNKYNKYLEEWMISQLCGSISWPVVCWESFSKQDEGRKINQS